MFRYRLTQTNEQIKKQIRKSIKQELDEYIANTIIKAAPLIRLKFKNFMQQSTAFNELSRGFMAPELGFPAGSGPSFIYKVIEQASLNLDVQHIPGKVSKIIVFLRDGWQDNLLASYDKISSNGTSLPWLHWLLTEGSKTIIFDHTFVERPYGRHGPSGRSGRGIMIQHSSWRVPEPYTGTLDRNFITELFNEFSTELESIYREILSV